MIRTHQLPVAQFEALAAGGGDPDVVRLLKHAELSKRILQIRALLDRGDAETERAYNLLADVQRQAPDAVVDILLYPQVGAWVAGCFQRIHSSAGDGRTIELDLLHLGAIAAVAAIRGDVEISATVPVRDGIVALPSLGCAEVGQAMPDGTAIVRCRAGGAEVVAGERTVAIPPDPETDAPGWRGLRRLRTGRNGCGLNVSLDDLDPFRDRHGMRPATRLISSEVAGWQRKLDEAWALLVDHHPERAKAIAAGLITIVPLTPPSGDRGLSATATDAFGAVAMSPPGDAVLLAESLVHEFQHAKLGALLDLFPLYNTIDNERYYAPWRDDPRPLGGFLQGIYAYLGVTDFWAQQIYASAGIDAPFAEFNFALWREQTWRAIDSLLESSQLTPLGVQFAHGMRATLAKLRDVPVRPSARAAADDAAVDHALVWRLRHVWPDHEAVDQLAHAWLDGCRCPQITVSSITDLTARSKESIARADLRIRWIRSELGRQHPASADVAAGIQGATLPDIAYVQCAYPEAVRGYRSQVTAESENVMAWAGLSLALRHVAPGPAVDVLSSRPEVVAAVHRRVRELVGAAPDPVDLAAWLANSCQV